MQIKHKPKEKILQRDIQYVVKKAPGEANSSRFYYFYSTVIIKDHVAADSLAENKCSKLLFAAVLNIIQGDPQTEGASNLSFPQQ